MARFHQRHIATSLASLAASLLLFQKPSPASPLWVLQWAALLWLLAGGFFPSSQHFVFSIQWCGRDIQRTATTDTSSGMYFTWACKCYSTVQDVCKRWNLKWRTGRQILNYGIRENERSSCFSLARSYWWPYRCQYHGMCLFIKLATMWHVQQTLIKLRHEISRSVEGMSICIHIFRTRQGFLLRQTNNENVSISVICSSDEELLTNSKLFSFLYLHMDID